MSYATVAQLTDYAELLGVPVPPNADALLAAASRDLDVILVGVGTVPIDLLDVDQTEALSRAVCAQSLFRDQQGAEMVLALDDGLSSAAGVSFSLRPPRRASPLVYEEVAGYRLLTRSGCAPPPLPLVPTPDLY
jgi:hypothetical protein